MNSSSFHAARVLQAATFVPGLFYKWNTYRSIPLIHIISGLSLPHIDLFYQSSIGVTFLTTFAGDPMATLHAGTSLVTMEPAAMVHPLPIVTPGRIIT